MKKQKIINLIKSKLQEKSSKALKPLYPEEKVEYSKGIFKSSLRDLQEAYDKLENLLEFNLELEIKALKDENLIEESNSVKEIYNSLLRIKDDKLQKLINDFKKRT